LPASHHRHDRRQRRRWSLPPRKRGFFPSKRTKKISTTPSKRPSNSRFFPLTTYDSGAEKGHGRIEQRIIDVLPIDAADIRNDWPTVNQVCHVRRVIQRKKKGIWQPPKTETVYLITSLSAVEATPQDLLKLNRTHWGIEIMHRNKDVFLGEDGYTNRKDNAPHAIFVLLTLVLEIGKSVSRSPTQALEYFQDNKNRAFRLIS
jgi:predicted transposase YbfD/YdcC